jgi:hypothetical protein
MVLFWSCQEQVLVDNPVCLPSRYRSNNGYVSNVRSATGRTDDHVIPFNWFPWNRSMWYSAVPFASVDRAKRCSWHAFYASVGVVVMVIVVSLAPRWKDKWFGIEVCALAVATFLSCRADGGTGYSVPNFVLCTMYPTYLVAKLTEMCNVQSFALMCTSLASLGTFFAHVFGFRSFFGFFPFEATDYVLSLYLVALYVNMLGVFMLACMCPSQGMLGAVWWHCVRMVVTDDSVKCKILMCLGDHSSSLYKRLVWHIYTTTCVCVGLALWGCVLNLCRNRRANGWNLRFIDHKYACGYKYSRFWALSVDLVWVLCVLVALSHDQPLVK